eukprot:6214007-Pleurochrysis_carterae.AAC.2
MKSEMCELNYAEWRWSGLGQRPDQLVVGDDEPQPLSAPCDAMFQHSSHQNPLLMKTSKWRTEITDFL